MIDGWSISCEIVLIGMSLDFTDDQSTLVQVMTWCRQATSHYLSQCWPRSMSPYGITRPQWVNWTNVDQVQWICIAPSELKLQPLFNLGKQLLYQIAGSIWISKFIDLYAQHGSKHTLIECTDIVYITFVMAHECQTTRLTCTWNWLHIM